MKNLLVVLFLFFAGTALVSCCDKNDDLDCIADLQDDCVCIEIYDPVCGCNNVTYSNSCFAECNGITDYTSGECDK
jgi:hypothetical protein